MSESTSTAGEPVKHTFGVTVIEGESLKAVEPWIGANQGKVAVDDVEVQGLAGGKFANRFGFTHASTSNDDHAYRFVATCFEAHYYNHYAHRRLKVDLNAYVERRDLALDVLEERALFPSHLSGYMIHNTVLEVFWDGDVDASLDRPIEWLKIGESTQQISLLRLEERVAYDEGDRPIARPSLPYWHHNRVITQRAVPLGGWVRLRLRLVTGVALTIDDYKVRGEGRLQGFVQDVTIKPV